MKKNNDADHIETTDRQQLVHTHSYSRRTRRTPISVRALTLRQNENEKEWAMPLLLLPQQKGDVGL